MVRPAIFAGIEQWDMTTLEVSRDVWSLMRVASFTAQREIFDCRRAAVFGSDDVINLKRQQRNIRWDLAILTTMLGTLPDMLLKLSLPKALTARVQHA
jgi:hypothetical protein